MKPYLLNLISKQWLSHLIEAPVKRAGKGRARTMAVLVNCLLLALLWSAGSLNAQSHQRFNEFNMQPEVWHFSGPQGAKVDARGDLNISVPLMTVPGTNGLDFEITLAYKSGIKYHQSASWVGLGWNFDPGSITRDIQGNLATAGGAWGVDYNDDPETFREMPDLYYLSLPGSGAATMMRAGSVDFNRHDQAGFLAPDNGPYGFYFESHKPYKIDFTIIDGYDWPGNIDLTAGHNDISRFIITDDSGYRYIFELPSLAIFKSKLDGVPYIHPNVWRLVGIAGPNFEGEIEQFLHSNRTPPRLNETYDQFDGQLDWVKFEYAFDNDDVFTVFSPGQDHLNQNTFLQRIITPTHYAEFMSASRNDVDLLRHPIGDIRSHYRRLSEVILNRRNGTVVKKARFQHSYHLAAANGAGKLTLDEISFHGYEGSALPGYRFEYPQNAAHNPPWRDNLSDFHYDGLGYYNDTRDPNDGIDLNVDDGEAWSLRKITFPEGGSEQYHYENDRIDDDELFYYRVNFAGEVEQHSFDFRNQFGRSTCRRQGGARVTAIARDDGMGNLQQINYQYGPGRVPVVPPKLLPWYYDENINRDEFQVYQRGQMEVTYEWVQLIYPDGSSEKTFFETTFKSNAVLNEHQIGRNWTFHSDNRHLRNGIAWGTPLKSVIIRDGDGDPQVNAAIFQDNRQLQYHNQLRITGPYFSQLGNSGLSFEVRQIAPRVTRESLRTQKGTFPTNLAQWQTIHRQYDPITLQLLEERIHSPEQILQRSLNYAHNIPAYGGNNWAPATLSGLRRNNQLTDIAGETVQVTNLLETAGDGDCWDSGLYETGQLAVGAALPGGESRQVATFSVDFDQTVNWACNLEVFFLPPCTEVDGSAFFTIEALLPGGEQTIVSEACILELPSGSGCTLQKSGTFEAYSGVPYRITAEVIHPGGDCSDNERVFSIAGGQVNFIAEKKPVEITSANINTYKAQPMDNGREIWYSDRIYQLKTDLTICQLPTFNGWTVHSGIDPSWVKTLAVEKYQYGKPVQYRDGNNNLLTVYYGDNNNSLSNAGQYSDFAHAYVTGVAMNGLTRQFKLDDRFLQVNRHIDANGNNHYFEFDAFGRLTVERDADYNVLARHAVAFSRDKNDGEYSPADPNHLLTRRYFAAGRESRQYRYFDGLSQQIQMILRGNGSDDYSASELDAAGRILKDYKTYRLPATAERPAFDPTAAERQQDLYTEFLYSSLLRDDIVRSTFPGPKHDLNAISHRTDFVAAADVLPEFYHAADSVILQRTITIDELGHSQESFTDGRGYGVLQRVFSDGEAIVEELQTVVLQLSADGERISGEQQRYFTVPFEQLVDCNLNLLEIGGSAEEGFGRLRVFSDETPVLTLSLETEGSRQGSFYAVPGNSYAIIVEGSLSGGTIKLDGSAAISEYEKLPLNTFFKFDSRGKTAAIYPPNYFESPGSTPAEDWVSNFRYNTAGELVRASTPDRGETNFWYDHNGNAIKTIDARHRNQDKMLLVHYDFLNRALVTIDRPKNLLPHHPDDRPYWVDVNAYDRLPDISEFPWNQISAERYPEGLANTANQLAANAHKSGDQWQVVLYDYDRNNRVVNRRILMANGHSIDFHYEYDLQGQVLSLRTSIGEEAFRHRYEYDDHGYLVKVYSDLNGDYSELCDAAYEYLPNGLLHRKLIGEYSPDLYRVQLPYSYNDRDWITAIGSPDNMADPFAASYSYLQNGHINTSDFLNNGANTERRFRISYRYDAAGRLKSGRYAVPGPFNWLDSGKYLLNGIRYDANGNILQLRRNDEHAEVIDSLTYHYRGNNRLMRIQDNAGISAVTWDAESRHYAYDAGGNTTAIFDPQRGYRFIQYNYQNLPVEIERPDSASLFLSVESSGNNGSGWAGMFRYRIDGGKFQNFSGRGIHVIQLDPQSGLRLASRRFDMYDDGNNGYQQGVGLATYLSGIAPGRLVVLGVYDSGISDAIDNEWTEAAYLAIEKLGGQNIRSLANRDSYLLMVEAGKLHTAVETHQVYKIRQDRDPQCQLERHMQVKPDIQYRYNAAGQRIFKHVQGGIAEYYLVDTDRVMAVVNENGEVVYWNIWGNELLGRSERR